MTDTETKAMKTVQIYGTGCPKCRALTANWLIPYFGGWYLGMSG